MTATHAQKSASSSPRIVTFLKRHRKAVAVIGASIVFLTFVIKDAIRENVKDLVAGLQSAQDVFELEERHEISVGMLNEIRQRTDLIWSKTPHGRAFLKKNDSSGLVGDITDNANVIEQTKANLDNLRRFVDRLPREETALRTNVEQFQAHWAQLNEKYLKTIADLNNKKLSEDDEFDAWADLGPTSETLRGDVETLSDDVIARSDKLREQAEHRLTIVTWISYVLYTIGWSLTLLGRLFDLDLVPDAD